MKILGRENLCLVQKVGQFIIGYMNINIALFWVDINIAILGVDRTILLYNI